MYGRIFSIIQRLGTPLHELCHITAAFMAGATIKHFSLLNLNKGNVLGNVEVSGIRDGLVLKLIGIAPLIIMLFVLRLADLFFHLNVWLFVLTFIAIIFSFPSEEDVKFISNTKTEFINSILMLPTEAFVKAFSNSFKAVNNVKITFLFHLSIAFIFYMFLRSLPILFDFLIFSFFIVLLSHHFRANIYLNIGKILFYFLYPFSTLFIVLEGVFFYFFHHYYHEYLIALLMHINISFRHYYFIIKRFIK